MDTRKKQPSKTAPPVRSPRVPHGVVLGVLVIGWVLIFAAGSAAQSPAKLKIDIRSVASQDCMDIVPCDGASFYSVVTFDGAIFSNLRQTSAWYGRDQIMPNWQFVWDTHSQDTVDVDIEVWDEDGFLRGADDQLDLDPAGAQNFHARRLSFRVDIQECMNDTQFALTGEATGRCGRVTSTGLEPGIRGTIVLDVSVETPAHAPGLRVRCLHEPLWPQPGDTVTVTAEALNDDPVNMAAVTGADLEIWGGTTTAVGSACTGSTCTFQQGPLQAGSFAYGCRVKKGGNEAWSGWRSVQVGNTSSARAIPVLLTGPVASRIDMVLVPNRRSCDPSGACINYTSALDPNFLSDALEVIRDAYFDWEIHLRHQDAVNFWIATDMGDYQELCNLTEPADWGSVYAFADAGAILHRNTLRDCARPSSRIFSSEPSSHGTIVHEVGHSPFGLADEYCCDGGYWPPPTLRNVHFNENECRQDITGLLPWNPALTPAACREISEVQADGSVRRTGWWVSDPVSPDMMGASGDRRPQPADSRRIEFIYGLCKASSCLDVRP